MKTNTPKIANDLMRSGRVFNFFILLFHNCLVFEYTMTCICIFKAYVENTQIIQIIKAIKLLNTFNMTYYNTILN